MVQSNSGNAPAGRVWFAGRLSSVAIVAVALATAAKLFIAGKFWQISVPDNIFVETKMFVEHFGSENFLINPI